MVAWEPKVAYILRNQRKVVGPMHDSKSPDYQQQTFLPARRYASGGYCDRKVSVCPSVCPSRAGIVSKRRKLAA